MLAHTFTAHGRLPYREWTRRGLTRGRQTILLAVFGLLVGCGGPELPLDRIDLPPGFRIHVFAADVPDARTLRLGSQGTVFVGNRQNDKVYAVIDRDGDYRADRVRTIAEGLEMPNGLAFHEGNLYVATTTRILRFTDIESRLADPPEPQVVRDDLPAQGYHGWRYLGVGPDQNLYVSIGSTCNVCDDPGFSLIARTGLDGQGWTTYAEGVRNSVGFDWDPVSGDLWFTDNGRDQLGDNRPPDELNRADAAGQHFGYPYCHGADIRDPELPGDKPCDVYRAPERALGPHVAALGMRFYTGKQFPDAYHNQIFIAEHGSWNRSEKIGYRIMQVTLNDERQAVSYEPFATGWLQGQEHWGRPVDLLVMPDGSLLVSDDYTDAIYRIVYDPSG